MEYSRMENFVTELQKNIGKKSLNPNGKKGSRFLEVLGFLSESRPEYKILEFRTDGNIIFEVPRKTLNITFERLRSHRAEIESSFIINTMGELVIRENLNEMAQILLSVAHDDYSELVNETIHVCFGMSILRDKFVFKFHINLLQKILTEDVKKKIK